MFQLDDGLGNSRLGGVETLCRFPMLPVSTTANRISRSRNFRRRLVRSSHGMKSLIPESYEMIA